MNAEQLVAQIRSRGLTLRLRADKVRIEGRRDAWQDLLDDVFRNKADIVRCLRSEDPRPDLVADTELWSRLLGLAHDLDGADAAGIYGVLLALRCCGAKLLSGDGTLRLLPGQLTGEEYAADRERWLAPRRDALEQLLRAASDGHDETGESH